MSGEICIYVWDFFFKEKGQDLYVQNKMLWNLLSFNIYSQNRVRICELNLVEFEFHTFYNVDKNIGFVVE